ncbi:MAG: hypothetical protein K2O14_09545 [Oscillospiraceae bacterium]|nr:hypothetical protein [Oscillospiraceae bacterium]
MVQEFVKQMKVLVSGMINDIHTAVSARILEYNASNGTATVKPYGVMTVNGQSLDYPLISSVPVITCCSVTANVGIAFPIKAGDDCLLIFSEQDISGWQNGMTQDISLKYDLTNAIAIVGLSNRAVPAVKNASDNDKVRIFCGETTVDVEKGRVEVNVGSTRLTVADGNVKIDGNLTISGNIVYGGTCSKG